MDNMSDPNTFPYPFAFPEQSSGQLFTGSFNFLSTSNFGIPAELMETEDLRQPAPFSLSLVDPALLDPSSLTPPPEHAPASITPTYRLPHNAFAANADPIGWTSDSVTPDEMPLFRKLPNELKLHVFNKAIDGITTCTIIVKRMVKLDTGKRTLVYKEKGKPDVTIKRQWIFTYRMVTLESEAALLNVCAISRQAYKKRKPIVLSLVTSTKKKLDNEIHFSNEDEVIIDNESVFYIHHYLQRLRPPGGLEGAVFGWKTIKNLVIEARTIKLDLDLIQDDFMRQIGDLEHQRRAVLAPEERRKGQFPEGWFECQRFELTKMEQHGATTGVIFESLLKMVESNGGKLWIA
ncbi:hypothetical protein DL95DRAFT_461748 [Leptodontidium sp. 2 PMI_412]|nr:hypothetical protein DL95DRAFT_461748 [Leptodontidium sp. 2 PMI_412]